MNFINAMQQTGNFLKRLQSGTPQRALFVGIVLTIFAVLGAMIYEREQILASPTRVMLECEPVDPRSILSGDYVILSYKISEFVGEEIDRLNVFNEDVRTDEWIYVALREQPGTKKPHTAAAFSKDPDRLRADERFADAILIRGKAVNSSGVFSDGPDLTLSAPERAEVDAYRYLELEYGLESYFVPQREGLWIERELAKATVSVAVGPEGQTAVRDLFLDGEKVVFY